MRYVVVDHEVVSIEEISTGKQVAIVKKHYDFYKHIKAEATGNTITFFWHTWQGDPLPFEPIQVEISGELVETTTLVLTEPVLEVIGSGKVVVKTLNTRVKNTEVVVEL